MAQDTVERLISQYLTFAERETVGRSPLYERLARGVAADADILSFLADLPQPKQQPNLLLAAVKYLWGVARDWEDFRSLVTQHSDELRTVMMARRTQTNEPARCAMLLPALARLPQPLALLEVGAAAGLCLLPDRYAYDYDGRYLPPAAPLAESPPTFLCRTSGAVPVPAERVRVVWRAGLDLQPLNVKDQQDRAWLEALVWPDEGSRLELLRAAVQIAQQDPPSVLRGDLRTDLPALASQAPKDATLVVFHTSVLCYVPTLEERLAFARMIGQLGVVWISNEDPNVFPWIAERVGSICPGDCHLLAVNEKPIAFTDPHGTSIEWIEH